MGRTFALPLFIGITSIVGLLAALLGDGVYDAVSWLGLGIPVAAVIYSYAKRHCPPPQQTTVGAHLRGEQRRGGSKLVSPQSRNHKDNLMSFRFGFRPSSGAPTGKQSH